MAEPDMQQLNVAEECQPESDHQEHRIGARGIDDDGLPEHPRHRPVLEVEPHSQMVVRPG
jgi:hypothetical protein